jgi:DNA-binding MarR family transcriptional regulator
VQFGYDRAVPARVDSGPLASELRVVLGHLIRRLRTQHRFSLSQGSVLGRLDREGAQSTSKLAAAERVRPQSMGQTVGELEAQGLVERHADPSDGRSSLIVLTEAGRVELREDRGRREGWLAEAIEQSFSGEERAVLDQAVPLLARLAEL